MPNEALTLETIADRLKLEPILTADRDREIIAGYTSDLLSDVMANADEDSVLITIQAHKNTVAVAVLVGIRAVLVASSRPVPEDMVEAAGREGVAIYRSAQNQFTLSGRLWELLRAGV